MKKNKPFGELFCRSLKKTLLIMRIAIIFLVLGVLHAHATDAYSQKTRLSLNFSNTELIDVLDKIELESEFFFLYNEKLLDTERKVDIKADDQLINVILDNLFAGTDVKYSIIDRKIILAPEVFIKESNPRLLIQQRTITGKVTESQTGDALPGVNVVVTGTTQGAVTDISGNYVIVVPQGANSLTFTFVGMQPQEIAVGTSSVINVSLIPSAIGLEEVVVIGYGTVKRQHLTGAVGSIKMDDQVAFMPSAEIGKALYGKVSGVRVINTSGRPGLSSAIEIRGINSISAGSNPLIVIDGVVLPDYDLNTTNAADIESISILKDASSAAIYGSRGSGGVILITTKSGKPGKPRFTVNQTSGFQQLIRRIDVMTGPEFARACIDIAQNAWIDKGGDPNAPNTIAARGNVRYTWPAAADNPDAVLNTDWQSIAFRVAPIHKTDIGLSGGDANTQYYASIGYLNQTGIVINTDFQKYSLNLKIDSKVTDRFRVGMMLNSSLQFENRDGNITEHTVITASQYPRVYPIYAPNGYLAGPHNTPGWETHSILYFGVNNGHPLHRGGGLETLDEKRSITLANIFGVITILPGLTFKSTFDGFIRRFEDKYYLPTDTNQGPDIRQQARFNVSTNETISYTATNYLSYSKNLAKHQLDALVGFEFNKRDYYGFSAQRRDYTNDIVQYLTAGATITGASDSKNSSSLISGFARLNYNYDGKYMVSASFRRDGSSRFGPSNKWGNFPSISAGWRVSREDFMANITFISNLNIRASYGFSGNQNIGNYAWISSMAQGRVAFGDNLDISYYPSSVQNPDLRWERTKQQNLGFDLGFLKDRISIETDIYKSVSDDLLLNVPVPSTSGFTSVFRNIGEVQNTGFEFKLTTHNLTGKLTWTSFVTISRNRNRINALGPDNAPIYYTTGNAMQSINMVGERLFSYYGFQYMGPYMTQAEIDADPSAYAGVHAGDMRFKDINKDGVLDAKDRVIIGNNEPDFLWGFSNTFTFGNFDFSFLFQGAQGLEIYDEQMHRSWIYHRRSYHARINDRWRSEADPGDGYIPKLSVDNALHDFSPSSYYIQDGDYLRLQELVFGYNLPTSIARKLGMSKARVYFNGSNLFLYSPKSYVYDPETYKGSPTDVLTRGASWGEYPSAKVYSFGINVEF